jgi:hypothetical protein
MKGNKMSRIVHLENGSAIKADVIEAFDKAVSNSENINSSGGLNWNFVDADLCLDLGDFYSMDYLYECFEVLVDEFFS